MTKSLGPALMWFPIVGALILALVAVFFIMPRDSQAQATSNGFARVKLMPDHGHRGEGTAIFYEGPQRIDIALRVRGLSTASDNFYLLWLVSDSGDARVGGGFYRTRAHSFRGSAVVPGSKQVSLTNCRRARRLVVTRVSDATARTIAKRGRRSAWRRPIQVQGTRIYQGIVQFFERRRQQIRAATLSP